MRRRNPRTVALGLLGLLLAATTTGGCGTSPSYTARFWMTEGQTMALAVEGEQPTVQLAPDFGPLERVDWVHPDGTTTFNGVPPGGELLLTLRQGDILRFTDQLGSRVEIKMWNATGYTLTMAGQESAPIASADAAVR